MRKEELKNRLKLIDDPSFMQVILDFIRCYDTPEMSELAINATKIFYTIEELKRKYLSLIPPGRNKSVQKDLEDEIAEIKQQYEKGKQ